MPDYQRVRPAAGRRNSPRGDSVFESGEIGDVDDIAQAGNLLWGMPDVSGASAVNIGVHTHCQYSHTRLRAHWAPGIRRALLHEGDEISGEPRVSHAAGCDGVSGLFDN